MIWGRIVRFFALLSEPTIALVIDEQSRRFGEEILSRMPV